VVSVEPEITEPCVEGLLTDEESRAKHPADGMVDGLASWRLTTDEILDGVEASVLLVCWR